MKTSHLFLVFLCGMLLLSTSKSQAQWVQVYASGGMNCFGVAGTKVFAANGGNILLSTNAGATWAAKGTILSTISALSIIDTDLFAATRGSGVLLSTDNGVIWTPVSTGLTVYSGLTVYTLAVLGGNLFAGTAIGVFLSTNDGATWTQTGLSSLTYALAVVGNDLFAAVPSAGVYLSTDSGATWSSINAGLTDLNVDAFAVKATSLYAGTAEGVFLLTNGGARWTHIGLSDTNVTALAVSGANVFAGSGPFVFTGFYTAVSSAGVFVSTVTDTNWTSCNSGLTSTDISALAVSDTVLIAGTSKGIWRRPISQVISAVNDNRSMLPTIFSLSQNYPNPFNPSTTIGFSLKEDARVSLDIFNVLGQRIQTFELGKMNAGTYSKNIDMSRFSSGVYLYRIEAIASDDETFTSVKKMILIK